MLSMLVRLLRMPKRHFSKSNCGAYRLGKDLVNGTPIRQEFLKKALEWMAEHETREGKPQSVVGYMAEHQHDPNAIIFGLTFRMYSIGL